MNTNAENTPYLKKILVVDDTQTNRVIVKGLLKKRGFDVLEAGDGLEALAVYQNEAPDLVLMDVMMPGIDGYETARRMRALPGENWVPIIFVSGLNEAKDLSEGLAAGGDDYLFKPLNPTILLAKLGAFGRTLGLQRKLSEARQEAEAISNCIIDGVITIDEAGRIQHCNPQTLAIFGYSIEELRGQNVKMLMPEPYHSAHDGYLNHYNSGGTPKIIGVGGREVTGRRKNGELFAMDLGVSRIEVSGKRQFVGIVRDISVRKAQEQKILEQNIDLQRYQAEQKIEQSLAADLMLRQFNRRAGDVSGCARWLVPANHFSGDAIATAVSPDGRIFAMLADATGHGLAAAVTILPMLTLFYCKVEAGISLPDLVMEMNVEARANLPTGRFIGAALLCLDRTAQQAEIWVGGVPDVLRLDAQGQVCERYESNSFAFGVVPLSVEDCAARTIDTLPGEQFVLYSDGIVEMSNHAGELLGQERFEATLSQSTPATRLNAVKDLFNAYADGQEAEDDVSVLLVDA